MDHYISLNLHDNQEKDIKARINYILNVSIQMINAFPPPKNSDLPELTAHLNKKKSNV